MGTGLNVLCSLKRTQFIDSSQFRNHNAMVVRYVSNSLKITNSYGLEIILLWFHGMFLIH